MLMCAGQHVADLIVKVQANGLVERSAAICSADVIDVEQEGENPIRRGDVAVRGVLDEASLGFMASSTLQSTSRKSATSTG